MVANRTMTDAELADLLKKPDMAIYFHIWRYGRGVRVILKQSTTENFLGGRGRWTRNAAEALDFKTTPSAMDYALRHQYTGLTIVLKSVDPRYDLELPNCC